MVALIGLVAALLAGGGVFLVVFGLATPQAGALIQERLGQMAARPQTLHEIELQAPLSERMLKPMVAWLSGLVTRWSPSNSVENTRIKLSQAGNPSNLTVPDFMGIKGLLAVLLFGATVLMVVLTHQPLLQGMIFPFVLSAFGFVLPSLWLGSKIKKRRKSILKDLPDSIDLLTISMEAGLGFDSALQRLVDKSDNPLTEEFGRVISEMRVGAPRRDALKALVERTGVADLSTLVTAIIQADQLGVSVSNILRIKAEELRMKRRQRAEEQAHQAPIKILFPMVFFIFPPMFIMILGPAIPQTIKLLAPGMAF